MDRHGLQGVGVIMLASILMFVAFQHSDWFSSASSASPLTVIGAHAASNSELGVSSGLHHRTAAGSGSGRQLLQVATPAPAPAPAGSQPNGYISYGALTAGYVPCPAGSGRPYYTPNCDSATGPVQPYTRGCETISLCARS